MQRGQHAVQGDLENRAVEEAGTAAGRCPVQVAVCALRQAAKRAATVMAGAKRAKVVNRGEGAAGGDSEERATVVAALGGGGAIEVAVAGQQQGALRFGAIASREAVQQGVVAAGSDAEHYTIVIGAA